jgi:7-carboxy-7-deazaguanine synthase
VKTYRIKEIFDTLQGEGSRAGQRSVFVRFTGCNLWNGLASGRAKGKAECSLWCDSDFADGEKMTAAELIERMDALWPLYAGYPKRWVVITGGEPLLQVDRHLLEALRSANWNIAVETNGTLNPRDDDGDIADLFDHITLSPKLEAGADRLHAPLMLRRCTDLKVVLPGTVKGPGWSEDGLRRLMQSTSHLYAYVQPQDPVETHAVGLTHLTGGIQGPHATSLYETRLKECIDFVMKHPEWMLSLQTHKLIGVR